jgi:hypothetical protein
MYFSCDRTIKMVRSPFHISDADVCADKTITLEAVESSDTIDNVKAKGGQPCGPAATRTCWQAARGRPDPC